MASIDILPSQLHLVVSAFAEDAMPCVEAKEVSGQCGVSEKRSTWWFPAKGHYTRIVQHFTNVSQRLSRLLFKLRAGYYERK